MEPVFVFHFHRKHITAILIGLIFLLEFRKGYFKRWRNWPKSFSWKPYQIPFLTLIILTLLTFLVDSWALGWIRLRNFPFSKGVVDLGSLMGRDINCFTALAWLYVGAYTLKRERARKWIFGAVITSLMTSVVVTVFKFVLLRARPYGDLGPFSFFNWDGLTEDASLFQSFPSGDTAVVAGAASYFFYAARKYLWRWAILLLPLCTAIARISLNRHWPSDTLFSLGIGLLVGAIVWDYSRTFFESPPETKPLRS